MRPLNLQQFNKDYWYCANTDTVYEKTQTPYTFYRRERYIDVSDGSGNDIVQFRDNIVGMNEVQLPIVGSNVNTHQPNYSDGNERRRRHNRRRFRKTVPSAPRAISTHYLEPLTVDEYHKKYCTLDSKMNVWKYGAYDRYSLDSGHVTYLERLQREKDCLKQLRSRMGKTSLLAKASQDRETEKRGPRRRSRF